MAYFCVFVFSKSEAAFSLFHGFLSPIPTLTVTLPPCFLSLTPNLFECPWVNSTSTTTGLDKILKYAIMGREPRQNGHQAALDPPAHLCILGAPGLRVLRVNFYLFCFLRLRVLRKSRAHNRNALNSFSFMRVRTAFIGTEAWGMIPALISSPEGLAPVYSFQQFTTIKFCNPFALITIRIAGGGGSPPPSE